MLILIVGAGRVGSSVARAMLAEGHEVSCLDEDPDSHARLELGLDTSWEDAGGQFTVGTGLEIDALTTAGIERADVFVASTNGEPDSHSSERVRVRTPKPVSPETAFPKLASCGASARSSCVSTVATSERPSGDSSRSSPCTRAATSGRPASSE